MVLPCRHLDRITQQVQPTIHLLSNLDVLHPQVLQQHGIQPTDYKGSLVFRSAIESIRGSFIASSTTGRQAYVDAVLQSLKNGRAIADFSQSSSTNRHDFEIIVQRNPDYFAAIEVKGGEGNSINISRRPLFVNEFDVWCRLDGAIINQPANGAQAIINRVTNALVREGKQVDALFIKDVLCGTSARPCPKYPGSESTIGFHAAPDIFLFPQRIPTMNDPRPPVNQLSTLKMPSAILNFFQVPPQQRSDHIWEAGVELVPVVGGRFRRKTQVIYRGKTILNSLPRPWQP